MHPVYLLRFYGHYYSAIFVFVQCTFILFNCGIVTRLVNATGLLACQRKPGSDEVLFCCAQLDIWRPGVTNWAALHSNRKIETTQYQSPVVSILRPERILELACRVALWTKSVLNFSPFALPSLILKTPLGI